MTVTTELNRNDYVASASQTVFPYTFKIFSATDLEVFVNDVLQVGGYSVSGVSVDAGGDVTFAVGLDAADAVAIVRNTPYTQGIDYTSYTKFPAETQELGLDKNTILAIQTKELGDRSLRYAASYGGTVGREITAPVPNEILGYDALGNLTTYTFSGDGGSLDLATNLASTDAGKGSDLVGWVGNVGKTVTTAITELLAAVSTNVTNIATNAAAIVVNAAGLLATFPADVRDLTLANNSIDAVNDIDIEAGGCADSTRAVWLTLAAGLTKQLDAAWAVGDDAGGLDTGSFTVDTWYHAFIVAKADGADVDVLFSTSPTSPTMPTDYIYKRRIGSVYAYDDSATPTIRLFTQTRDDFRWVTPVVDVDNVTAVSGAVVTPLSTPADLRTKAFIALTLNTPVVTMYGLITEVDHAATVPSINYHNILVGDNENFTAWMSVYTDTSSSIRRHFVITSGDILVLTMGWVDGRDG